MDAIRIGIVNINFCPIGSFYQTKSVGVFLNPAYNFADIFIFRLRFRTVSLPDFTCKFKVVVACDLIHFCLEFIPPTLNFERRLFAFKVAYPILSIDTFVYVVLPLSASLMDSSTAASAVYYNQSDNLIESNLSSIPNTLSISLLFVTLGPEE